jgi:hypothetical protein
MSGLLIGQASGPRKRSSTISLQVRPVRLLRDADANLDLPEQVNGSAIAPPGKLSLRFLPDDDPQP